MTDVRDYIAANDLKDAVHIGDGVYLAHDGYHTWVMADRDGRTHAVALEPGLPEAIVAWRKRIEEQYR